jgi:hypothetical protein
MSAEESMRVVVLVKAAPVMTRELEETMCVAGVRVDEGGARWVRLHPVPFRDLEDELKFVKYQTISLRARRPRTDRRPETWSPVHGTLDLGAVLDTDNNWARRRQLIEQLGEARTCDLVAANKSGSGPGTPSLAVVRPVEPPTLEITERDEDQLKVWAARAKGAEFRQSLFDDDSAQRKAPFEVVPWRFRYRYRCTAPDCSGHAQTIVDWEAYALWRHIRHRPDWEGRMRAKFEHELWHGRDSVLFIGNQEQHPTSFLVLGVFWPRKGDIQGVLDL